MEVPSTKLKILIMHNDALLHIGSTTKQTVTKNQLNYIETIVIYIHGGGWVSMTSELAQTYSRKWAKDLKVPVINLSYTKAPE